MLCKYRIQKIYRIFIISSVYFQNSRYSRESFKGKLTVLSPGGSSSFMKETSAVKNRRLY
jgi:hypothetical protein